jgi:hypothetical protein
VPTYAHLYDLEVSYLAEVKPIFQRVCFDCHGDQRSDAWYKDVYGLRHWLSSKQQAGRKKLILDQGLPFGSDLDNLEIVRKLKQQLDDGTMPPLSYRLANWYDMLGYDEMKVVKHWLHRAERVMEGKEVDPTDFGEREASTGELKGNGEHRGREGS